MKDNLKEPCKECPFRKNSLNGWLGNLTAKETHDAVLNEADFACHMTRKRAIPQMSRCKGSQIFLLNHCKSPKFNIKLRDALDQTRKEKHNGDDYLGFDFIKHHTSPLKLKKK